MFGLFKQNKTIEVGNYKYFAKCNECDHVPFPFGYMRLCEKCGSEDLEHVVGRWHTMNKVSGFMVEQVPIKFEERKTLKEDDK